MSHSTADRWAETGAPPLAEWGLGSSHSDSSLGDADFSMSSEMPEANLAFRLVDPAIEPTGDGQFPPTESRVAAPATAAHVAVAASDRKPALRFPECRAIIGGFRIVSELGRGAFARVYLAEQEDLGGRPVALKVAEALGEEPQALARLQHTHIVPIHSVHDDPRTGLRLLCMPFVGGANLAQVLDLTGATLPSQASGRSLVEALDHAAARSPSMLAAGAVGASSIAEAPALGDPKGAPISFQASVSFFVDCWHRVARGRSLEAIDNALADEDDDAERDQPARRFFRSHTYIQASAWIAARLAEGLAHAHERGILHRDLKPSNILIAADGTPMLLDFNLAGKVRDGDAEGDRALIGGTLPYMAPEHLDAFNPMGQTPASAVDERSDIYAMGLILFEMLTGRHPFGVVPTGRTTVALVGRMTEERLGGAPSVRSFHPLIPPSLDAIVAKCLHPEAARRYTRASDLAEDLQRFLDDRPNAHAPEPSLGERSRKWWRRHPKIRGAGPVAVMAVMLLGSTAAATVAIAESALRSQAKLARSAFRDRFARCQLLLNTTGEASSHRRAGIALGERMLATYRVRSDDDWESGTLVRRLPLEERLALREELSELMLLLVRARVADLPRLAEEKRRGVLEASLALLDRAEATDPHPSSALFEWRASLHRALGDSEASRSDRARALAIPPRSARDFYLRGTQRAARGDRDGAESDLVRAVALDPRRFWAWFVLGLCHFDSGRHEEAVGEFNVCTLLAPEFSWPHLNRGLSLAALGRLAAARASFDRALALSPDFVEARVDRALVCLEMDEPSQAAIDLARAVALGRRDAPVLAAKAEALSRLGRRDEAERDFAESLKVRPDDPGVLVARGISRIQHNPEAARADFDRVLARDPRHPRALYGRAILTRANDPRSALDDLNQALDANPRLIDALRVRAVLRARLGEPEALSDADRLAGFPTPHNLYASSCALALFDRHRGITDHRARAREFLDRALKLGFPVSQAEADPDLASLRDEGGAGESGRD